MRIAIIAPPFYPVPPPAYGGTEWVMYYLIKGLKEQGHQPVLIGPGNSAVDCEIVPNIAESIPFPKKDNPEFHQKVKAADEATIEAVRSLADKVDIFHSHGFDMLPFADLPNVTTVHGHIGFPDLDYFKRREGLPFVSISRNQQASYPELNWVGVAYNGEDPADFTVVEKPEDYFCFIGRFDWDKCPHLAIDLAEKMDKRLIMAGKIDLEGADYFKKEIEPRLKPGKIDFLGEVGLKDKIELISHAQLNLHPLLGRREPFGLTVIESGYCGTPTLAINKGALPELIGSGRGGLAVEDFVEGYHKIDKLLALDRRLVAAYYAKKFNYRRMSEAYLGAYQKVLKYHTSQQVEPQRSAKLLVESLANKLLAEPAKYRLLNGKTGIAKLSE